MTTANVVIDTKTRALDTSFTYEVPSELLEETKVGCAVLVDFNNKKYVGFVIEIENKNQNDFSFKLNPIIEVLSEPFFDEEMAKLITWISHKYISPLSSAARLAIPPQGTPTVQNNADSTFTIKNKIRKSKKFEYCEKEVDHFLNTYKRPEKLNIEQQHAIDVIIQEYKKARGHAVLLDGVTGSGKTEVYLQVIEKILDGGKNAIVLVPEIALTPQTVSRFTSRFGKKIAIMHSKMTLKQRREQWFWIEKGEARIVIGPRSALFTPLKNVGIIVIDEEHESTYKQESSPRYDARAVAKKKMEISGGVLVAGSATPSLDTLFLSSNSNDWQRVTLTKRPNLKPLPKVQVVDMTKLKSEGKYSIFSEKLKRAIIEELKANRKVILLLNQRGYSKFILCENCGFVPECPNCSTTLTFHEEGNWLKCHHCGYQVASPPRCPKCTSPHLKRLGTGTQKVESTLHLFLDEESGLENTKIVRMDSDSTATSGSHDDILKEFDESPRSILLGTQMIAKGLDFKDVSLVGVINADTTMHVPDFRSTERTFALIEQVSGRCGRGDEAGNVIVQTYEPDNSAIRAASTHDRELFLRVELPKRKVLKFPPYVKFINIIIWSKAKDLAEKQAKDVSKQLKELLQSESEKGVEISDAIPCPYEKLQKSWRFHVLIKAPLEIDLSNELENFFRKYKSKANVNMAIDVDPTQIL